MVTFGRREGSHRPSGSLAETEPALARLLLLSETEGYAFAQARG